MSRFDPVGEPIVRRAWAEPRERTVISALFMIAGVGGMIGLFLIARAFPQNGRLLHIAAMVWFLAVGVLKVRLFRGRGF